MIKTIVLLFLFIPIISFAFHPPKNIKLSDRSEKAVFVDFKSAVYDIEYNVLKKKAYVKSTIKFTSLESGFPIFDLIPAIKSITLDGKKIFALKQVLGRKASTALRLNTVAAKGEHILEIRSEIQKNTSYKSFSKTVASAFWMSDLGDRKYLEQYLPTNLEYDQYQYTFNVKITGSKKSYEIFTNAKLKEIDENHFQLVFPKHFTASSSFFHLTSKNRFKKSQSRFTSIDGREILVTVYGKSNISNYMTSALKILKELESDYGRWPHDSVVIYGAGQGGMEYCGATITSISALGHELTHSYFARGVMPARGNAGWIDEAMASWRDSNYKQVSKENLKRTKMAGHSTYRRTTDRAAYSSGRDFIGFLDKKFDDLGGMKSFMKKFHKDRLFAPILTSDLISDLNEYFSSDVTKLFNNYIYGKYGIDTNQSLIQENPIHKSLSEKELKALL